MATSRSTDAAPAGKGGAGRLMTSNRRGALTGAGPTRREPRQRNAGLVAPVRYRFGLARSPQPLVITAYLGLVALGAILSAKLLVTTLRLAGNSDGGRPAFAEALWPTRLRGLDTGWIVKNDGWLAGSVILLVTLSGIFMAASLIGLIVMTVDQHAETLRKGRGSILESGHTLVLEGEYGEHGVLHAGLSAADQATSYRSVMNSGPASSVAGIGYRVRPPPTVISRRKPRPARLGPRDRILVLAPTVPCPTNTVLAPVLAIEQIARTSV